MAHPRLKLTTDNIINLWFGIDTPIKAYKIKLNPELWAACQRIAPTFRAPSGALSVDQYRKADKVCFARIVQQVMRQEAVAVEESPELILAECNA